MGSEPPDLRRAGRQESSRPLVENLFVWLSAQFAPLSGSSPDAKAIRYALSHQDGWLWCTNSREGTRGPRRCRSGNALRARQAKFGHAVQDAGDDGGLGPLCFEAL